MPYRMLMTSAILAEVILASVYVSWSRCTLKLPGLHQISRYFPIFSPPSGFMVICVFQVEDTLRLNKIEYRIFRLEPAVLHKVWLKIVGAGYISCDFHLKSWVARVFWAKSSFLKLHLTVFCAYTRAKRRASKLIKQVEKYLRNLWVVEYLN